MTVWPDWLPKTLPQAEAFYVATLADCRTPEEEREARRALARGDLFYLLTHELRRPDLIHPWLFARCREVQRDPNGRLDLWAREHYKSTIITFGLTVFDILNDPEITACVFSHTRPMAKGFLRQIKQEFETNKGLVALFDDILWADPINESPKWSEDEGIVVKRQGNPKEATLEAYGLVDGMPTGKHYKLRIYDDIVTEKSVTTPEMMAKTTRAWELSDNLGAQGGWERYIGTRYHFNDTWRVMMDREVVTVRLHPARLGGAEDGEAVFMPEKTLRKKRQTQGPYTFGTQMLLNPKGDDKMGFKEEWLRYYQGAPRKDGLNIYLLCDAASEKRPENDYTSMFVCGLGADRKVRVLDMVRDRLSLTERGRLYMSLHRRWQPLACGYEKYGMMGDVEYIKELMERENYYFDIIELGGSMPKNDRIRRLIPYFEQGRILLPEVLRRNNYEGEVVDLPDVFVREEYLPFPVGVHDDMMDCLSRLFDPDLQIIWPMTDPEEEEEAEHRQRYSRYGSKQRRTSEWAA